MNFGTSKIWVFQNFEYFCVTFPKNFSNLLCFVRRKKIPGFLKNNIDLTFKWRENYFSVENCLMKFSSFTERKLSFVVFLKVDIVFFLLKIE